MKTGMIFPVRRNFGLGNNQSYNNASESLHAKFKQRINQCKTNDTSSGKPTKYSCTETTEIYQGMCERVQWGVRGGLADKRPYKLTLPLNISI